MWTPFEYTILEAQSKYIVPISEDFETAAES